MLICRGDVHFNSYLLAMGVVHMSADDIVNRLAVVLKMLYLADLRELQTDLNSLMVLGQEFTANP